MLWYRPTLPSPIVLNYLISFVEDANAPAWQGYAYALAMFGAAVLQSIFLHQVSGRESMHFGSCTGSTSTG